MQKVSRCSAKGGAPVPYYRVESSIVQQLDDIRSHWLDLEQRADCAYFKSWGWIGIWLQQIALDMKPLVIKVWSGDLLVGIGLFVSKNVQRRLAIRSKAMFLNEYPFDDNDMVIEYNGLLVAKGLESEVYNHTVLYLRKQYPLVDEFHFGAVANLPDCHTLEKCALGDLKFIVNDTSECRQVELDKFEPGLDAYLICLSGNTRGQIRRSLRIYEDKAPVVFNEATSIEEALIYFESLKVLHTERWRSKGESGSFANRKWIDFHRALIEERFKFGEIQMIKITNSSGDIAFLFNYVWRRKVYVLQMGFNYPEDKRCKPGYVAHALAIVYNKDKDMAVYDFMHGDGRYKKSLGLSSVNLNWVVLQRPKFKFLFERLAVGFVRRLRQKQMSLEK